MKMSKTLATLLVKAKEMNKYVPVKHLVKYGLNEFEMLNLEDAGLLTVIRTKDHGILLSLTAKGYHHFASRH
jgi:hypothetical protein